MDPCYLVLIRYFIYSKVAWRFWLNIGTESTKPQLYSNYLGKPEEAYVPNQAFLTSLVQIFPAIFKHIKPRYEKLIFLTSKIRIALQG